jgi:hypothetical protein
VSCILTQWSAPKCIPGEDVEPTPCRVSVSDDAVRQRRHHPGGGVSRTAVLTLDATSRRNPRLDGPHVWTPLYVRLCVLRRPRIKGRRAVKRRRPVRVFCVEYLYRVLYRVFARLLFSLRFHNVHSVNSFMLLIYIYFFTIRASFPFGCCRGRHEDRVEPVPT